MNPIKRNILVAGGAAAVIAMVWWSAKGPSRMVTEQVVSPVVQTSPPVPVPAESAAPPVQSEPAAAELIQIALGRTGASFAKRSEAVQSLGTALSLTHCMALYELLREPMADQEVNSFAALKNRVMRQLRQQPGLSEQWPHMLIALFEDSRQHEVTRDYALQHLFAWYKHEMSADSQKDARGKAQSVMWAALKEPQAAIAGTALLGLHQLAERDLAVDRGQVKAAALEMVQSSVTPENVRTSALQVCGRLQCREVLPMARSLVRTGVGLPVRVSAIATLGTLGEAEDQTFLQQLRQELGPESPLQAALSAALERLSHRSNG